MQKTINNKSLLETLRMYKEEMSEAATLLYSSQKLAAMVVPPACFGGNSIHKFQTRKYSCNLELLCITGKFRYDTLSGRGTYPFRSIMRLIVISYFIFNGMDYSSLYCIKLMIDSCATAPQDLESFFPDCFHNLFKSVMITLIISR